VKPKWSTRKAAEASGSATLSETADAVTFIGPSFSVRRTSYVVHEFLESCR
jgi:hypothetical protein